MPRADRSRVEAAIAAAIARDQGVIGAILIGSVANGTSDAHSDLDYYVYVEVASWPADRADAWWSRKNLGLWLIAAGIPADLHFWTGVGKHHLLISRTRVDISLLPDGDQRAVEWWPQLFFPESAIIKDANEQLRSAYAANPGRTIGEPLNDYCAYVLALMNVAIQLSRGEVINARNRFVGLIESRARLMRALPLGTPLWREPTRHAEQELLRTELDELFGLAFTGSPGELRSRIFHELERVANNGELSRDARESAASYARQLQANEPVS